MEIPEQKNIHASNNWFIKIHEDSYPPFSDVLINRYYEWN